MPGLYLPRAHCDNFVYDFPYVLFRLRSCLRHLNQA